MICQALMHTLVAVFVSFTVTASGLLDGATTEVGLEHYAENQHGYLYGYPDWLLMPANTLVNIGYMAVGVIWLWNIYQLQQSSASHMPPTDAYMFYIFSFSSFLYGPIQFIRIVTQTHRTAILDQWVTLPIFAWVIVWSLHIQYGWSSRRTLAIVMMSFLSYALTLYVSVGFELALGIHIIVTVITGLNLCNQYYSRNTSRAMWLAVLSCIGFVGLKLMDHQLATYHVFFQHLTGHFWSKVCDCLQIYFVCQFFLSIQEKKMISKDG